MKILPPPSSDFKRLESLHLTPCLHLSLPTPALSHTTPNNLHHWKKSKYLSPFNKTVLLHPPRCQQLQNIAPSAFEPRAEVRIMIWKEAIGNKTIHIGRCSAWGHRHEDKSAHPVHLIIEDVTAQPSRSLKFRTRRKHIRKQKRLSCQIGLSRTISFNIGLLLTCRKISYEVADILYSTNTFSCDVEPWLAT